MGNFRYCNSSFVGGYTKAQCRYNIYGKKSEVEIGVESDGTVLASPIYQELYAAHFSRPSSYNPATYKFPVLESLRPVVELDQNVPLL